MKATHRIIVHAILKINGKYLVTKRAKSEKVYSGYWDIPGGMVEEKEIPQEALKREVKEEVNLNVEVRQIIHEDSNLDKEKGIVFTRLVYICEPKNCGLKDIYLKLNEHDEYRLISSINELGDEKIVEYLEKILKDMNRS